MATEVNSIEATPPLRFLSDKPTEDDKIGIHKAIADGIKQIVMGDLPKPFVVGLFGSWGSGKSSIVEMLKTSRDRRFEIVVIDAWRKDKDNFLRQFVKKLASALLPENVGKKVCDMVNFKTSLQTSSWIPGTWATVAFFAYVVLALLTIGGTIWVWHLSLKDDSYKNFPIKEIGGFIFLILAAVAFQWLLPRYSKKCDIRTEEVTIEDPSWFRKLYFEEILNRSNGQSVCVVVDNLDRVPTEDALAIIKFIKTFIVDVEKEEVAINRTKVTFLFPCDDTELITRIESDKRVTKANEFLRKFINVSMRIPPLLEQDNTNYIRGLIRDTGLQTDNPLIEENMAFIISRVADSNPRKPKTILNHFVARFNLTRQFPDCADIARKHPDWFLVHSIAESEFGGTHVSDYVEPTKRMGEQLGGSVENTFHSSIRPILDEIPVSAWRVFQFLKKSNPHNQIRGFDEITKFALERNQNEFAKLFRELLPNNRALVSLIWNERKDGPSRMAFAEMILWEHEGGAKFPIPATIISDIAFLIQTRVTGWIQLPPVVTYELVIKPRKECVASVLRFLNSDEIEGTSAALPFVQQIAQFVHDDFQKDDEIQPLLASVFERYGPKNAVLIQLALKQSVRAGDNVFNAGLAFTLDSESGISPDELLGYIQRIGISNQQPANNFVAAVLKSTLQALLDRGRPLVPALKLGSELIIRMDKFHSIGLGRNIQGDSLMSQILKMYDSLKQAGVWEGICTIQTLCIKLQATNVSFKSEALGLFRNRLQEFVNSVPENILAEFFEQNSKFIHDNSASVIMQIASRSCALAKMVYRKIPQLHSDVVSLIVSRQPSWIGEFVEDATLEKSGREALGLLIVQYLGTNPPDSAYDSLSRLKCEDEKYKKAIERHFDLRIASPEISKTTLMAVLRAMDLASYSCTNLQRETVLNLFDSFPMKQLGPDDAALYERVIRKKRKKASAKDGLPSSSPQGAA